jgi:hypothetical protein
MEQGLVSTLDVPILPFGFYPKIAMLKRLCAQVNCHNAESSCQAKYSTLLFLPDALTLTFKSKFSSSDGSKYEDDSHLGYCFT